MPQTWRTVIVAFRHPYSGAKEADIETAYYDKEQDGWINEDGGKLLDGGVTHWQELPKSPTYHDEPVLDWMMKGIKDET